MTQKGKRERKKWRRKETSKGRSVLKCFCAGVLHTCQSSLACSHFLFKHCNRPFGSKLMQSLCVTNVVWPRLLMSLRCCRWWRLSDDSCTAYQQQQQQWAVENRCLNHLRHSPPSPSFISIEATRQVGSVIFCNKKKIQCKNKCN